MVLRAKDIRNESEEELEQKLLELGREIFTLRSAQLDNKSQKTHLIGQKRKEIARIKTCQNEKKKAAEGAQ